MNSVFCRTSFRRLRCHVATICSEGINVEKIPVRNNAITKRAASSFANSTTDLGDGPPKEGAVVLVSGGVESSVLLHYWVHWDHAVALHPLYCNYGQKGASMELAAAQAVCKSVGLPLQVLDLSSVGQQFRSMQAPLRRHIPLPHRNLALIAMAASYAGQKEANQVALSLIADDLGNYSSSSAPFLESANALLKALDPPVELLTPMQKMSKAQVVALGERIGVPWKVTYSCMLGQARHCGRCSQCLSRQAAFAANKLAEPEDMYEERPVLFEGDTEAFGESEYGCSRKYGCM